MIAKLIRICFALLGALSLSVGAGAQAALNLPAWFPTTPEAANALHARAAQGLFIDGIAATFAVNTTKDTVDASPGNGTCADAEGNCSLRAAVMEANASPGGDSITVPAGQYILTLSGENEYASLTGDLNITDPDGLVITGPATGAPAIIDGNDNFTDRVIEVRAGAFALSDIVLTNATWDGLSTRENTETTLTRVTVTENDLRGINAGDNIRIFDSLIANNGSGGLSVNFGAFLVWNTTITGNTGFQGAGVYVSDYALRNSLIVNSTITGNVAIAEGGGIFSLVWLRLRGTILAGNSAADGPDCNTFYDLTVLSEGDNLIGNNSVCNFLSTATDQVGTGGAPLDPLLGPLADNGGRTLTRAPLPGSPVRDAMSFVNCAQINSDQRGVARPQDADADGLALCDIGAVEVIQPFTLAGPISRGLYHSNRLDLVWTAADGATKYKIEVKGTNKPFSYTRTKNAAKTCLGFVCRDTRAFANLTNQTNLRWRVTALGLPTARVTPWQSFRVEIPRRPALIAPQAEGVVADPSAQLRWEADNVTQFVVRVRNSTGKVLKIIQLNATSNPTINDACNDVSCAVSTGDFGLTLGVGKSYAWSVEALQVVVVGGTTTRYRSRSAWAPFTVVSDPPLLNVAGADGLRGVDPAR
jgi:CSLREA domain-containing protein